MESGVQKGKVFVGGISQETTEETLRQHFGKYGEIDSTQVIKYRETGCGRGFGFVTFVDSAIVPEVIQVHPHLILGRKVEVKVAKAKGEISEIRRCQQIQRHDSNEITSKTHKKKIFVGGLPPYLSEEDFKKYFGTFGRIENATIIYNKENNKPRGFGFVTYESEEAVKSVLQKTFHPLCNKLVEVKQAKLRENIAMEACYNTSYGWWPTYGPNYYSWVNMPHPSCYFGPNIWLSRPTSTEYFTPRHLVTIRAPNWNNNDNRFHASTSRDCNTEVQPIGDVSFRAYLGEKHSNTGETSHVNIKAVNDEKDQSTEAAKSEKQQSEKKFQDDNERNAMNTVSERGQSGKKFQDDNELDELNAISK